MNVVATVCHSFDHVKGSDVDNVWLLTSIEKIILKESTWEASLDCGATLWKLYDEFPIFHQV